MRLDFVLDWNTKPRKLQQNNYRNIGNFNRLNYKNRYRNDLLLDCVFRLWKVALRALRPVFRRSDRYKNIYVYMTKISNSRNFQRIGFPEVLLIFYIEKIHFLILPKQNTFTKHEKLKNCVNTANTKTNSIFILFWLQIMIIKSTCICVCFKNTNTE